MHRFPAVILTVLMFLAVSVGAWAAPLATNEPAAAAAPVNIASDLLPDPGDWEDARPQAAPTPEAPALPDPEPTAVVPRTLPNPGSFFVEELTEPFSVAQPFNGKIFDSYVYRYMVDYEERLAAFRDELDRRGFVSYPNLIGGQSALVIEDKGHTAYLFIGYKGREQFMFMVEQGFEMDEQETVTHTLEKGDVILTFNGSVYEYENCAATQGKLAFSYWQSKSQSSYSGFYTGTPTWASGSSPVLSIGISTPHGNVEIDLPRDTKTGQVYKADHSSSSTSISLDIFGQHYYGGQAAMGGPSYGGGGYTAPYTEYYNLMEGEEDFLEIQVIWRDDRELKGTISGRFENGAAAFFIDFWVPIQ